MSKKTSLFTAILLLLTIAACTQTAPQKSGGVINIQQNMFAKILNEQNAIIVDVRTPEEVSGGVIKGASVFADIKGASFETQIAALDTSKTYIVYCRSGARSASAAEYMSQKGFKHVYNLEGGITAWKGEVTRP